MKAADRIALRYIFGKRSLNIITVISFISILGITTGVAVIIIVMAIFNGFRDFTENQLFLHDPHIRIYNKNDNFINNDNALITYLSENKQITSYSPILKERTAILKDDNMMISEMTAVPKENINYLNDFTNFMVIGKHDPLKSNTISIGAGIADQLSIFPGDTLNLVSPELIELSLRTFRRARPIQVIISGVFQTNNPKYDHNMIIGSTNIINKLTLKKMYANFIDVKIKNPYKHKKIQNEINNKFPDYRTSSWKELNIQLYNVMQFEQLAAFSILSIIIIIAVFNILASLTMSVIDKKADIGILKAMGANSDFIIRIFRNVGLFAGSISTVAGTIMGLGFCYLQINFKIFKVDTTKFIIDSIPMKIDYIYVIAVALLSLLLTFTATLYPAKRAASINVINALRDE